MFNKCNKSVQLISDEYSILPIANMREKDITRELVSKQTNIHNHVRISRFR